MALLSELRAALRSLASAPAFVMTAVFTVAGALGMTAVVLAVIHAYVVRALPFPDADRLYRVDYAAPGQPAPAGMEALDWASLHDVVELSVAWDLDVFFVLGSEFPISAPGAWVTPGYVEALGVRVARGRPLVPSDFASREPVALISHQLWESRFSGAPDIVGRTFHAYVSDRPEEAEAFTIVGVLPPDHWHLNAYTEVLTPLRAAAYPYQVRLRPGVSPLVAGERIDALIRSSVQALPPHYRVTLTSVQDSYVAAVAPLLWSVAAASALVLLIAAANVMVLMIVRARRRQREWAVRVALGATPWRASALLVLEGGLIGGCAIGLALLGAHLALGRLAPIIERSLERRVPGGVQALSLDAPVILLVILCGLVMALAFTLAPVALVRRSQAEAGVARSARGIADGAGRSRAVLLGVELAASLTLLVGAGLMIETAARMLRVDFGVEAEGVMTAGLGLRLQSFPDARRQAELYDRVVGELRRRGHAEVALSEFWPLQEPRPRRVEARGDVGVSVDAGRMVVSSDYFALLRIPILDGRAFGVHDRLEGERTAVVSASLAARLWPRGRAVGESLVIHSDTGAPATAVVVGVVADTRQSHTDTKLMDLYLPIAQHGSRFAFVYVRSRGRGPSFDELRAAVAAVNREVALSVPRPLGESIEQARVRPRFLAAFLTTFAVLATALATTGMYGVITYAVRQRRREIAVRLAVGATVRAVAGLFLREGVPVLAGGLSAGVLGALALGRVLQSQLFDVEAAEPRVLAAAVAGLGACALAAMLLPAWRAASTADPARVLNHE